MWAEALDVLFDKMKTEGRNPRQYPRHLWLGTTTRLCLSQNRGYLIQSQSIKTPRRKPRRDILSRHISHLDGFLYPRRMR